MKRTFEDSCDAVLSTITEIISVLVVELNSNNRKSKHLPTMSMHKYHWCAACSVCNVFIEGTFDLHLTSGRDSTSLIRLCANCKNKLYQPISATHRILKLAIDEYIRNSAMKRLTIIKDCYRCFNQGDWKTTSYPKTPVCAQCLVTVKWAKYRWIYMVTRHITICDIYLLIESFVVDQIRP